MLFFSEFVNGFSLAWYSTLTLLTENTHAFMNISFNLEI